MGKLVLITGGARSGKSSYALDYCENISTKRCFIATSPVTDPEMADRIAAHKIERQGRGWQTIEEEVQINAQLRLLAEFEVVLIDCLTLWINNLLYVAEQQNKTFRETQMRLQAEELAETIQSFAGVVCLVTNEVGMGIVPENTLARRYRDLVGCCNHSLAKCADEVILVACGLPLKLKSISSSF